MSLLIRRFVFVFFTLAYLATSTLILLYGLGYSFRFGANLWRRTGIISFKAQPDDAQLYLNGKQKAKKFPHRIARLPAGVYEATILKAGYHPWRKTLEVKAGETTFAHKTQLWKQSLPMLAYPFDGALELRGIDQDVIIAARASSVLDELIAFDLKRRTSALLSRSGQQKTPTSTAMQESPAAQTSAPNRHEIRVERNGLPPIILWRTAEIIQEVHLLKDTEYLLVRTNKKTRILELDTRSPNNIVELPVPANVDSLILDEDAKTLYFSSAIGKQRGIFALELR